jgi:hypothetical protein
VLVNARRPGIIESMGAPSSVREVSEAQAKRVLTDAEKVKGAPGVVKLPDGRYVRVKRKLSGVELSFYESAAACGC